MSAKPAYLVDANVLLRFLLNDHAQQAAAALKLFDSAAAGRATLHIPLVAIYEAVVSLETYHKVDRHDTGRELLKLLQASGVKLSGGSWIIQAVDLYRTRAMSFGEACHAAEGRALKLSTI